MKSFIVPTLCLFVGPLANAQAPPAQPTAQGQPAQQEVKVVTTKLGGNVYGIDGQGGRAAALPVDAVDIAAKLSRDDLDLLLRGLTLSGRLSRRRLGVRQRADEQAQRRNDETLHAEISPVY